MNENSSYRIEINHRANRTGGIHTKQFTTMSGFRNKKHQRARVREENRVD